MCRSLLTIVALFCACTVDARAAEPAAPRPDIIFLLADDLGHNDVGFTGGIDIRTPNLDALAARGAILNQFYAHHVCTPTRAALMTGRYPIRYGLQVGVIRPWGQYGLPLEERTLPHALRDAGYYTAMTGKWHLGSFDKSYWPHARGFDSFHGHLFGAIDYDTHLRDGKPDWYRNDQPLKEEGYSTHLIAREAARVIHERPKDKPLFLYVAFNAVHAPLQVPEKYKEPYANLRDRRRTYAGMLTAMDEAVGRIVDAVDKSGRRNNTLFVFSSDNGGPNPERLTDNGSLRDGKGTLYEGGVRVCAFATWDGRIKPRSTIDQPLHTVDWYPTLLNLAGAPLDQKLTLDGLDAWPTIAEGRDSPHDDILINAEPTRGALRAGDWKLVLSRGPRRQRPDTTELFNLRDDPSERTNLAAQHPEKLKDLRSRYEAYAKTATAPHTSDRE
jgi:arylsulfatase A-like enzyme